MISSPSLRIAAGRTVGRCRDEIGAATEPAQVLETVVLLATAVDQPGGWPQAVGRTLDGPAGLAVRALDSLRSELVREWSSNGHVPDATEIVQTLAAFERVREDLQPQRSPDLDGWLAGSHGLDFVSELAHDLRSPLTAILTLAETLRRGQSGEVNENQRRQLGLIYSAALGLSTVASNVIELAHGGERLAERHRSPFSMAELLESVHDIVQPMAEEKGIPVRILSLKVDQRRGYPVALSRVILNLTTNALKFTEEGCVTIAAHPRGTRRAALSIQDTGRGISPEDLKTLFQPFRRCSGGRNGHCFSGTGLGLAISRRLVEAMGSTLCVETRSDCGTRFHFELDLPPVSHV